MGKRSLIGWSAVLAAGLLAGCVCGDMEDEAMLAEAGRANAMGAADMMMAREAK